MSTCQPGWPRYLEQNIEVKRQGVHNRRPRCGARHGGRRLRSVTQRLSLDDAQDGGTNWTVGRPASTQIGSIGVWVTVSGDGVVKDRLIAGALGGDGLGLDGSEASIRQPTNQDPPRLDEIGIFVSACLSKVLG